MDAAVETPHGEGPAPDSKLMEAGAPPTGVHMTLDAYKRAEQDLEQIAQETQSFMKTAMDRLHTANSNTSSQSKRSTKTAKSGPAHGQMSEVDALLALTDMSPKSIPQKPVVESLVLSSLVLTAFAFSSFVGSYLAFPVINTLIQPIGACLMSAIVIPVALHLQLSNGAHGAFAGLRLLLAAGIVQGLLTGAAIAHTELSSEPIIILSTLTASFSISAASLGSRHHALAASIGSSVVSHLLIGFFKGFNFPYIGLTLAYTAAAALPIQMAARDQNKANVHQYTAISVAITVAAKSFMYGIAGASTFAGEAHLAHGATPQLAM